MVDDLDHVRFLDPGHGLRCLVVVEQDDRAAHVIEQGCPREDAGERPLARDNTRGPER